MLSQATRDCARLDPAQRAAFACDFFSQPNPDMEIMALEAVKYLMLGLSPVSCRSCCSCGCCDIDPLIRPSPILARHML